MFLHQYGRGWETQGFTVLICCLSAYGQKQSIGNSLVPDKKLAFGPNA